MHSDGVRSEYLTLVNGQGVQSCTIGVHTDPATTARIPWSFERNRMNAPKIGM